MKRAWKTTMATAVLAGLAVSAEAGGDAAAAEPVREWKTDCYCVNLFDRYSKNSGLLQVFRKGILMLRGENAFASIQEGDKQIMLRTKPQAVYSTAAGADSKSLTYKAEKILFDPKAPSKEYAKSSKTILFGVDGFQVNCTMTALENLGFNGYESNPYKDQFSICAESVKDWTLEGTTVKDENVMAKIPVPCKKEKWGIGNTIFKNLKFSGAGCCISIDAGEGTCIRISYYEGARGPEIYVSNLYPAKGAPYQLGKGETFQLSYTVKFEETRK